MQNTSETSKKMDIIRGLPRWTSNYCFEHIPKHVMPTEPTQSELATLQEKYKVQMMEMNNEEVCPRCACEQETKRLEDEASAAYNHDRAHAKYDVFEKQSIFKDMTLKNASFDTYVLDENEHEARVNKQQALQCLEEYRQGHQMNLWFTGHVGVGKSHLSMSLLNELNSVNTSCLFLELDEMFRLINDAMFHDKESRYSEKYFIDLAISVDFLVMDDLGAETGNIETGKKATDYKNKVLRAIVNGRQDKSTIITTNLSYQQVIQVFDPKLVDRMLKKKKIIKFEKTLSFRSR